MDIRPYKNRPLPRMGTVVRVYRNLTKNCLSIQVQNDKGKWEVVGHCHDELMLYKATFIVNEKGRDWVRKTGKKTAHAYVMGYLSPTSVYALGYRTRNALADKERRIVYNPYKLDYFTRVNTGLKVENALYCKVSMTTGITAAIQGVDIPLPRETP